MRRTFHRVRLGKRDGLQRSDHLSGHSWQLGGCGILDPRSSQTARLISDGVPKTPFVVKAENQCHQCGHDKMSGVLQGTEELGTWLPERTSTCLTALP